MPVMIKHNEATECCVTNGAEGEVVSWISKPIADGKNALETLFICLTCPPCPIKLPGLPENVVPLTPHSKAVKCKLLSSKFINVNRTHVAVLPNFAMTDFGSQGHTRVWNVYDLNLCRSHQSIYNCLSHRPILEDTIII